MSVSVIRIPLLADSRESFSVWRLRSRAEFLDLMRSHPSQGRKSLELEETLDRVAQAKAEDLGARNYFSHTEPGGLGPNYRVLEAGYPLPYWYQRDPDSNNIEILGGGFSSAIDLFTSFQRSEGHKIHLLGLHPMFSQQTRVGIGIDYNLGSKYKPIWCIISCPPRD